MTSRIEVRQATVTDIPQLTEVRWESSSEDDVAREDRHTFDAKMHEFLEQALADPRWTIWIAADGEQVVTTVYAQLIQKVPRPWPNDGWVYVTGVFTRAERRNRGIGSLVLAAVREWASARGLELLMLWPSERSMPFYERAGFHPAESLQLEL